MSVGRSRATRRIGAAVLLAAFLATGITVCAADDISVPVPTIVIYPRDVIKENMLGGPLHFHRPQSGAIAETRAQLVGKVARQTLIAGQLDSNRRGRRAAAGDHWASGAAVRPYNSGGIVIVTYGLSLQSGTAGELVRARNIDSGVNVSGVVQSDGSLLVGGL